MDQVWIKSARLTGDRVLLRPVGPGDVQACFDFVHDQNEITDWLVWDGPATIDDIMPWYLTWPLGAPARGCDYHFAIVDREDGQFSGAISLRYYDHSFRGDVGYWMSVDKWGRGLASEALGLVTWLAFEHTAAQLVYAECFDGNERSMNMLKRWDFELDPRGEARIQKAGKDVIAHFLSLSRRRWKELGGRGVPKEAQVEPGGA
ncbi:MAG: ribosomal-protein-alanine N-acetyltransferase [Candidatus Paceibacteria bacterium]|jgi:ribosomal-protein-alanine N-acetyltransferase